MQAREFFYKSKFIPEKKIMKMLPIIKITSDILTMLWFSNGYLPVRPYYIINSEAQPVETRFI